MAALRDAGISIHQIGPTQHGHVRVAVEGDALVAQATLDEMSGSDVIRVVEEPRVRLQPLANRPARSDGGLGR
jgi:hypothetical protein